MSDTRPLPEMPRIDPAGHKGCAGAVLIVAGSTAYAGAAALAAAGASCCGPGYVRVAVPRSIASEVRAARPWIIVAGMRETAAGAIAFPALNRLRDLASGSDVVALGPGLTTSPDMTALLLRLVEAIDVPIVIDADALNALAGHPDVLRARTAATVLTPHPGEAARWLDASATEIQRDRGAAAVALARLTGAVVALKGAGTVVVDGDRVTVNETGNVGLATGGTGDVLTGVVAALVARGLGAGDATRLGVWLHGRAADIAAGSVGEAPLTPLDVCAHLPHAIREATPT